MAAKRQTRRRKASSASSSASSRARRTASSRAKKAAPSNSSHTWDEVLAILLLGSGLLYFLALVSYNPVDLPEWVPFSRAARQPGDVSNFIGPLGAVIAGYSYFFLGAACFLGPAALAWFGISILLKHRVFTLPTLAGFVGFLVSGACLAELQDAFFQDWPDRYNIAGAGGVIGYGLGNFVLLNTVGKIGSLIVMSVVYLVSLILVTGLHPFQFLRMTRRGIHQYFVERKVKRAAEAAAAEKIRERESAAGPRTHRPSQDKEVEAPAAQPTLFRDEEIPSNPVPPPKIIDASVRQAPDKNTAKPSLADLLEDRRKGQASHESPDCSRFPDYKLPELELLHFDDPGAAAPVDKDELLATQNIIVETLATFGIQVTPGDITRGPTITRYEIYPGTGLRVNRITALEADIARATKAERINIIAPIPGKDTVGIEIANSNKVLVPLRELLEDSHFCSEEAKIPLALGKDVYGKTIVGDLAQMPHLLVAGATGSGKSVCINSIIASILYRFSPDELRFILIDPKVVEMQNYNSLPHLVVPVVTDPKKVLLALRWVVNEMDRRYRIFAEVDVRDFDSFNGRADRKRSPAKSRSAAEKSSETPVEEAPVEEEVASAAGAELVAHPVSVENADKEAASETEEIPERVPYIVVIIDELADLMQTAPVEVEGAIQRLAQKARAAGIHLILATQTPRKEVITGNIKTNVPTRIAFQVPSKIDSRVILDTSGAEKLVGKGDMLYVPPGSSSLIRAQGAFITDEEIQEVVEFCASQGEPSFESSIQQTLESGEQEESEVSPEDEEIVEKCIEVIQQEKRASTSLLQRRLRLGYTRAARMIDILEERGIIGPGDGAKPREILVDLDGTMD